MVYVAPPQSPQEGPSRPGHRRMRSHTIATDTPAGPGAFAPVTPPRRKSARKGFYFEDDESPSPHEDDALSPLVIDNAAPATSGESDAVPFPSHGPDSPGGPPSPQPPFSRTPSTGSVILANGRPLKSSLKSSASAPYDLQAHVRTKSEPATPSIKSVHFREDDDLEDVKVYNRTGRPANLLVKPGEETETETEAENAFPFLRTAAQLSPSGPAPLNELAFEIDGAPDRTSAIPQSNPDKYANIHLESISLPKSRPASLRGTVLVRNIAFEKQVALRFTFDDWQTTSEVFCKHVVSLPGLPPPFPRSRTVGDAAADIAGASAPSWDRFSFQIMLEDYVDKLADRTLWIVARYTVPGQGEWWDNNAHANYRVQFRRTTPAPPAPVVQPPSPVVQQRSFVPPATLRTTPPGSPAALAPASDPPRATAALSPAAAYAATVFGGRLTASPRGSPSVSPRVSPAGSPRVSPSGSPRVSPDASLKASPSGSPNSSDNERRRKPPPGTLGLGARPAAAPRAPGIARSNSSPPVYSPGSSAQFFAAAAGPGTAHTRGASAPDAGATSPLMARLSRLALSNYARPAPVTPPASPEERRRSLSAGSSMTSIVGGQPATLEPPVLMVTEPSPPPPAPTLAPVPEAPTPTPASEDAPAAPPAPTGDTSTSTSESSSPMVGTPPQLSAADLSTLVEPRKCPEGPPTPVPRAHRRARAPGSGSSSSGSDTAAPHGARRTGDLVLDIPAPVARGSASSPFSPTGTPRYSLDAALLGAGAPADGLPRVGTGDANYAAFLRQWCFARSPSPSAQGEATVRVEVGVPREANPRTRPTHGARAASPSSSGSSGGATPVPYAPGRENTWLGVAEPAWA